MFELRNWKKSEDLFSPFGSFFWNLINQHFFAFGSSSNQYCVYVTQYIKHRWIMAIKMRVRRASVKTSSTITLAAKWVCHSACMCLCLFRPSMVRFKNLEKPQSGSNWIVFTWWFHEYAVSHERMKKRSADIAGSCVPTSWKGPASFSAARTPRLILWMIRHVITYLYQRSCLRSLRRTWLFFHLFFRPKHSVSRSARIVNFYIYKYMNI